MKDLFSGLNLKVNTVNGYLLEIVKREKDVMLVFRYLSQKWCLYLQGNSYHT